MISRLFGCRTGLSLIWIILGLARSVLAAAPANDTCAGAVVIPSAGPFPYYTPIIDVRDATTANDPPLPTCRSVDVGRSVWYKFTPSGTRLYTISVSEDTGTTVLDTVMAIYTSSAGCNGPFTQFQCNDDQGDTKSAIPVTLNANVTYYIVVWMSAVSPPVSGLTSLQLRVSQPVAPTNDTCAGAEVIPGSGPFPYLTSIADTTLATTTGDPVPSCWPDHVRSVWYQFRPAAAATYELSLCTNTATTVYETVMAIYTSVNGCSGPFTAVACNHTNACGNKPRSTITTALAKDTTYYIVAWEGVNAAYTPGETSLQLRVTAFLPPVVVTLPASSITSTSAVLKATINPNGLLTTAWFQWGTTTNYGQMTPLTNIPGDVATATLSNLLSGFQPGQTIHFRVAASNSIGVRQGVDRSFAWSAAPPRLTILSQSNASVLLQFNGQASQTYFIEASSNLTNWLNLGLPIDLGNGSFSFSERANLPSRSYRTRSP